MIIATGTYNEVGIDRTSKGSSDPAKLFWDGENVLLKVKTENYAITHCRGWTRHIISSVFQKFV